MRFTSLNQTDSLLESQMQINLERDLHHVVTINILNKCHAIVPWAIFPSILLKIK